MKFEELKLEKEILNVISKVGYKTATEIQEKAIPEILEKKDIVGCAQTGTGKTAAFAIPIINNLHLKEETKLRVLVLTPTRELASQVRDSFKTYSKGLNIKTALVVGGVNQRPQKQALREGVDVLIATPGRALDLMNQKSIKLHNIDTIVLDEADTMLDMGFIEDIEKIIKRTPSDRQTLLFSATMPKAIRDLAKKFLKDPINITIEPDINNVVKISETIYYVDKKSKTSLLLDLLKNPEIYSGLIFTRTKRGADSLYKSLKANGIKTEIIHGDKSQNSRTVALRNFKKGKVRLLIATDIAARGIDVSGLSHVINYDLPEQAETYIHRIGRTGRAGQEGVAISFCDSYEKKNLRSIERVTKKDFSPIEDDNHKVTEKGEKSRPSRSFSKKRGSNDRNSNKRGSSQRSYNNKNSSKNSSNKRKTSYKRK